MSDFVELGQILRTARESGGKTVADLSKEMGLPESYLAALEAGDMAALPDRTYARIYFINYARTLGLDTEDLMQQWPRPRADVTQPPVVDAPSKRVSWPLAGLGAVAVVILVFMFWPGDDQRKTENQDLPQVPSDSGHADTLSAALVDTASTDTLAADTAAPVVAPSGPVADPVLAISELRVDALGESWVVVEADGDTVEARVMVNGQSITVEGREEFALTAASPQHLMVVLNGKPITLPKRVRRPLIRHRIATREGAQ